MGAGLEAEAMRAGLVQGLRGGGHGSWPGAELGLGLWSSAWFGPSQEPGFEVACLELGFMGAD